MISLTQPLEAHKIWSEKLKGPLSDPGSFYVPRVNFVFVILFPSEVLQII